MTERKEKFTPEPWTFDVCTGIVSAVTPCKEGEEHHPVCEVFAEGNGYLISAAPEMYALLDHIEDVMDDSSGCGEIPVDKIREVLKKARGEEWKTAK